MCARAGSGGAWRQVPLRVADEHLHGRLSRRLARQILTAQQRQRRHGDLEGQFVPLPGCVRVLLLLREPGLARVEAIEAHEGRLREPLVEP